MNDEIETRRAAKLRALKSGCCMWSPILPPAQGSDTGQEATSKAAANTTNPNSITGSRAAAAWASRP